MRHAAAFTVNVKSEFALWILRREIDLSRRRVEAFCHHDKMMDQLFHLSHDMRFRRRHVFPIRDVDWSAGEFAHYLAQDPDALSHFFDTHQITIVTVTRATDHNIEI